MFSELILSKSYPAAIRRVREHRRLGHRTVLITGALDFVIEPLRPLFDDIVCAELGINEPGGRKGPTYNGELRDVPPTGETRAQALMDFAALQCTLRRPAHLLCPLREQCEGKQIVWLRSRAEVERFLETIRA